MFRTEDTSKVRGGPFWMSEASEVSDYLPKAGDDLGILTLRTIFPR